MGDISGSGLIKLKWRKGLELSKVPEPLHAMLAMLNPFPFQTIVLSWQEHGAHSYDTHELSLFLSFQTVLQFTPRLAVHVDPSANTILPVIPHQIPHQKACP